MAYKIFHGILGFERFVKDEVVLACFHTVTGNLFPDGHWLVAVIGFDVSDIIIVVKLHGKCCSALGNRSECS